MTDTAKSVIAGTFKPAMVREGLGEMMAIAPFGPPVPDDVQKLVAASADQVEKGFNPFAGPVTDNTGAVKNFSPASPGAATRWAISTGTSRA